MAINNDGNQMDSSVIGKSLYEKNIKALRLEGLVSVESIDVTDVGIERLQQLFPDEDFDS